MAAENSELLQAGRQAASAQVDARAWTGNFAQLTEEQLDRLTAYRRSKLSQKSMARIYESIAGHKPTPQMLIVLCGVAKLYVGDLTEAAVLLCAAQKEQPPLRVEHLALAYQHLRTDPDRPPDARTRKRLRL